MATFQQVVTAELARAEANHGPIHSFHEGYAVILEELDEVKELVWKRQHDALEIFKELVQVAAMAERMAKDLLLTEYYADLRLERIA